ncbi:hypothetical protein U1Q18_012615 [Sarracenia purpurea var. burkii]
MRTLQTFRRKSVELHKNDHDRDSTINSTSSSKVSIKYGDKNDTTVDVISNKTHQNNTSPSPPRKSVSTNAQVLVKENIALEQKEDMKMECYDNATSKNRGEEMENEMGRKEVENMCEGNVAVERDDKRDNTESEDDEDGRISDYDGPLWIGSPSFREYCTNDSPSEDSFKIHGDSDGEKKETKTKGDNNKGNTYSKPNEEPMTQSTRGRKGRRFRKVFPTGRSHAMRNLFHVTSCYNPNISAARDNKLGKPIEKTV